MQIIRRLGTSPRQRGSLSGDCCPDIFELGDGNFAVIGRDATIPLTPELPLETVLGDDGRIVIISRETLMHAKQDIPDIRSPRAHRAIRASA
ncbi:hypothetical protein [Streptomyces sp. NPDC051016]|uniref:hypothetical protein n=1 Tax=Streptomyces sp. NPDC051016 TaxID=3365638 RepID=UPI0037BAFC7C